MMINVFVLKVIARVSKFIISVGKLDLQLQEIYGMSAYVQDRTQSNPDVRQTAVQCLGDGDLLCIENKNKRSQRKVCLPLEPPPIDGL